jgi:KDO2-lipid IV(A) lauroyltransferase
LQGYIDTMPGQYYWVHKRFKTRPEGEKSVYQ